MTPTGPGRREGSQVARMRRWPKPCLMLITDRTRLRGRPLEEVVSLAVAGGVDAVQLREKDLSEDKLSEAALSMREAAGDRALLLVNGSISAALAARADGVHLPEQSVQTEDVRRIVGDEAIIGRSVHGVEAALQAEREGIDFVQVGTVFETASKPGATPAGVELVREVTQAVRLPVIAVGGITTENVAGVVAAGADGVAVIGAIMDAEDPRSAAAGLRDALENAQQR